MIKYGSELFQTQSKQRYQSETILRLESLKIKVIAKELRIQLELNDEILLIEF